MEKISAGILLYRKVRKQYEVLLVHPGGPFWKNKDLGAWSVPKGEAAQGEDLLEAALRELHEETTIVATGNFIALTPIRQKSGKIVYAWAHEKDVDPATIQSNTFPLEWPPHSGKKMMVPEVDRGAWFTFAEAKTKILPAQVPLLTELAAQLHAAE